MNRIQIGLLIAATDVVGLADPSSLQPRSQGRTVIADVDPVPYLLSIAVDREGLAGNRIRDHERQKLFGKLVRTVVVRAVGCYSWQIVTMHVRTHQVIGCCFGSRVRTVGRVGSGFLKGWGLRKKSAVHLVRRNVEKAKFASVVSRGFGQISPGGLEQPKSAVDIRSDECFRTGERTIDVTLRGKMQDGPWLIAFEQALKESGVADVTLLKMVGGIPLHGRQVLQVTRIGKLVKVNDRRAYLFEPFQDEVRANEARSASDDDGRQIVEHQSILTKYA